MRCYGSKRQLPRTISDLDIASKVEVGPISNVFECLGRFLLLHDLSAQGLMKMLHGEAYFDFWMIRRHPEPHQTVWHRQRLEHVNSDIWQFLHQPVRRVISRRARPNHGEMQRSLSCRRGAVPVDRAIVDSEPLDGDMDVSLTRLANKRRPVE